ncbi:MAG TPA: RdgB/HAM1 family non-canonical purine NTP pyrophosphatase [Gammaproteobacteria bacterium]|jgi:XTP/dITP diphosphohydrolase|nr:RdgB/HAM1 family non-canonical purine NTP pyrophosphatase [Gammaproteobacteria bacterium]
MKIILASNNPGKVQELKALLATRASKLNNQSIHLVTQKEVGIGDIEETGHTFVENAILKARHAAHLSGLPAIADDSGLVVAALHGAPGIYSARYAGPKADARDNIQKLLAELKTVSDNERQAYFYCVLIYLLHASDPTPLICQGIWQGTILHEPRGTQGFGYDPIFYVPTEKKSAAELPLDRKNSLSHRGQALRSLIQQLSGKLCTPSPSIN